MSATFAPNDGFALRLDIDKNNAYDALTDGLLILRHLLGRTGFDLTTSAIGSGATLAMPTDIKQRLDNLAPLLDVDGNGQLDALTDGLLLFNYLTGLRGSGLVTGMTGTGATRTGSGPIESYIQSLLPP